MRYRLLNRGIEIDQAITTTATVAIVTALQNYLGSKDTQESTKRHVESIFERTSIAHYVTTPRDRLEKQKVSDRDILNRLNRMSNVGRTK